MQNNTLRDRHRAHEYRKHWFYCTDHSTVMSKFCNFCKAFGIGGQKEGKFEVVNFYNLVPAVRMERGESIRAIALGKQVAMLFDEITDKQDTCVFVVLFQKIEAADCVDTFVIDVYTLETTDAKYCTWAILDTHKKFDVGFDNVLALVLYMVKCIDTLANIMAENVVVIQYWTHKLNLVMNVLRKQLPELQNAPSKVKLAFLKPGKECFSSVSGIYYWLSDCHYRVHESEEVASVNNSEIEFLTQASRDEIQMVKIQAVFVKENGKDLVDLITILE
ncbi:hypothetical protein PR048_004522 [Dryococelus australis]|uniref:Uncharacterized protein n=1 Tax=Dryococelus australis TaxID=614101 RepID=A0ABQ9I5N3_9NEOP|nr:hypothetical protein PR048_004522 [Dryococelus australis]